MSDYTVFQCLAVKIPTKEEKKKDHQPSIITDPVFIIASDIQKAGMKFMASYAPRWDKKGFSIDNIDLVIRPF